MTTSILRFVLIFALATSIVSCKKKTEDPEPTPVTTPEPTPTAPETHFIPVSYTHLLMSLRIIRTRIFR